MQNETGQYGPEVDVYSYGVVLWEIATRQAPYADDQRTDWDIRMAVINGERLPLPADPECPDALSQLMEQCWAANRLDRPSFASIVHKLNTYVMPAAGSSAV